MFVVKWVTKVQIAGKMKGIRTKDPTIESQGIMKATMINLSMEIMLMKMLKLRQVYSVPIARKEDI